MGVVSLKGLPIHILGSGRGGAAQMLIKHTDGSKMEPKVELPLSVLCGFGSCLWELGIGKFWDNCFYPVGSHDFEFSSRLAKKPDDMMVYSPHTMKRAAPWDEQVDVISSDDSSSPDIEMESVNECDRKQPDLSQTRIQLNIYTPTKYNIIDHHEDRIQ
ncbi:hypothetical protein DVH24_001679 [Malus domestica]|uniref:Uncharacterized protein n=1 Tax=Malus domestica TaxID=3750 RepID=A0A498I9E5_MALDO|nr:hypothetical protein DVH24_001679 [Malus domestica]